MEILGAEAASDRHERLTAIKAKYDPHNIFHRNVNINQPGWGRVPAAGGGHPADC